MDKRTLFHALLAVAVVVGVVGGYGFDHGKNAILLTCLALGPIVLLATYFVYEKLKDEEYGNRIGKF